MRAKSNTKSKNLRDVKTHKETFALMWKQNGKKSEKSAKKKVKKMWEQSKKHVKTKWGQTR